MKIVKNKLTMVEKTCQVASLSNLVQETNPISRGLGAKQMIDWLHDGITTRIIRLRQQMMNNLKCNLCRIESSNKCSWIHLVLLADAQDLHTRNLQLLNVIHKLSESSVAVWLSSRIWWLFEKQRIRMEIRHKLINDFFAEC